jgi:hypothetical protein
VLSPRGDGAIDAEWCGAPRSYHRVDRSAAFEPLPIAGRFANASLGLDVEVSSSENGRSTYALRSRIGALQGVLTPVEPDLYLLTAGDETGARPGRPWMASIKVDGEGTDPQQRAHAPPAPEGAALTPNAHRKNGPPASTMRGRPEGKRGPSCN